MKEKEMSLRNESYLHDPTEAHETLKGHYLDAKNLNIRYKAYIEEIAEQVDIALEEGVETSYFGTEIEEVRKICEKALNLDEQ